MTLVGPSEDQLHFHRLRASALRVGLPFFFIGPGLPLIRAQKDFLRGPPSGWGAFRLDPVAALYLALPFAVRPPFLDFSPRPKERLGFFLGVATVTSWAFSFELVCPSF